MAQNDNQQHEYKAYKKEDAYETLGIINTWIGNMDTKVSFALTLAGVLIGVIFEKGMPNALKAIGKVTTITKSKSLHAHGFLFSEIIQYNF